MCRNVQAPIKTYADNNEEIMNPITAASTQPSRDISEEGTPGYSSYMDAMIRPRMQ
jgi:hypothetical protein